MTTAPDAPGAGVRKPPKEEIAGRDTWEVRRALSEIDHCTEFWFRRRMIFGGCRPRMRAQLWRYGTSVAKWGFEVLHPVRFQRVARGKNSTRRNLRVINDSTSLRRHDANRRLRAPVDSEQNDFEPFVKMISATLTGSRHWDRRRAHAGIGAGLQIGRCPRS